MIGYAQIDRSQMPPGYWYELSVFYPWVGYVDSYEFVSINDPELYNDIMMGEELARRTSIQRRSVTK